MMTETTATTGKTGSFLRRSAASEARPAASRSQPTASGSRSVASWSLSARAGLVALLTVWIGGVFVLGESGVLTTAPAQAFRPILITVAVPIALFLALYAGSPRLRRFVLTQDLAALTMLQHWRVLGFAFLMLYAHDVLPALFAWPAGFGDIAIGFATPLVVLALARHPDFATSRRFVVFNLFGLLDFAAAAATASLASGAFPALLSGPVTSAPMEAWPLMLFPAFFVPVFAILHLSVLVQVAAKRRREDA